MSKVGDLLRSGYAHAMRSKELANEAQRLATESMTQAMECYKFAANVHDIVMEAARPFLELAEFNAELAAAAAHDAEYYAKQARQAYAETLNTGREVTIVMSRN